jgi:hypothetical protein
MKRFVEGLDRGQSTLFPASLDDYVTDPTPPIRLRLFRARIRASQARKLLAQCQCCTSQTGGKQPEGPQWRKQRRRWRECTRPNNDLRARRARLCDSDVQPLLDGSADLPREHFLVPRVEGSAP